MDSDVRVLGRAVRVPGGDAAEGTASMEPARNLRIGGQRQLRIQIGLLHGLLLARCLLLLLPSSLLL